MVSKRKRKNWDSIKRTALNQISSYFRDAEESYSKNMELANRYVDICRRISMRCKVRIPKIYKRKICNKCKKLLIPGKTSIVRVRHNKQTHVTITCLNCKHNKRYYIDKRKNR